MKDLPILAPGDEVQIVAPASRLPEDEIHQLRALLESWQLICHVEPDLLGHDLLCANSDEHRLNALIKAFEAPNIRAVICARGGYGSQRLIPAFAKRRASISPKLFFGMSDITALHLFLNQRWGWSTLHGSLSIGKVNQASIAACNAMLFTKHPRVTWSAFALNLHARKSLCLESCLIGGNLTLVQTSIGTIWEINAKNKIIFLEETGERAYRIDRMLNHLQQAERFIGAKAIIFGDFIGGDEPNGNNLIQSVLQRFAEQSSIPVLQIQGVGHGVHNFPLPLGTPVSLNLGERIELICYR
jgi:muramoyltetrapeptide carboxypeptidase